MFYIHNGIGSFGSVQRRRKHPPPLACPTLSLRCVHAVSSRQKLTQADTCCLRAPARHQLSAGGLLNFGPSSRNGFLFSSSSSLLLSIRFCFLFFTQRLHIRHYRVIRLFVRFFVLRFCVPFNSWPSTWFAILSQWLDSFFSFLLFNFFFFLFFFYLFSFPTKTQSLIRLLCSL